MAKCEVCLNHAKWWNDRNETGCICRIGYDLAHELNCEKSVEVHCGQFVHQDPNQRSF